MAKTKDSEQKLGARRTYKMMGRGVRMRIFDAEHVPEQHPGGYEVTYPFEIEVTARSLDQQGFVIEGDYWFERLQTAIATGSTSLQRKHKKDTAWAIFQGGSVELVADSLAHMTVRAMRGHAVHVKVTVKALRRNDYAITEWGVGEEVPEFFPPVYKPSSRQPELDPVRRSFRVLTPKQIEKIRMECQNLMREIRERRPLLVPRQGVRCGPRSDQRYL